VLLQQPGVDDEADDELSLVTHTRTSLVRISYECAADALRFS